MSKYEPLKTFLAAQSAFSIPMKFKEIEDVIGFKLPDSAYHHRAWWSNNVSNNVMTAVWMAAGFETASVDMEKNTVIFCRTARAQDSPKYPRPSPKLAGLSDASRSFATPHATHHRLRGALKGTIRIAVDVDLTLPADPEWGETS